jgi:hypothetical protein
MSQSNEQVYTPKRDLHVGGLGPNSGGTLTDYDLDTSDEESGEWDGGNDLIERVRSALRDTDRFVHESPWAALGVVGALGFLAGLFFARRT